MCFTFKTKPTDFRWLLGGLKETCWVLGSSKRIKTLRRRYGQLKEQKPMSVLTKRKKGRICRWPIMLFLGGGEKIRYYFSCRICCSSAFCDQDSFVISPAIVRMWIYVIVLSALCRVFCNGCSSCKVVQLSPDTKYIGRLV